MTEEPTCPVPAALGDEPSSPSSIKPPEPERELPLGMALRELGIALRQLAIAMDEQNQLLGQIVAQNADLIVMIAETADEDEEPTHDLAGRPIR